MIRSIMATSSRFDMTRLPGKGETLGAYLSYPRFLRVAGFLRIGSLKGFSIPTCEAFPRVWSRTRVTEMGDFTGRQSQQDAPSDRYRK